MNYITKLLAGTAEPPIPAMDLRSRVEIVESGIEKMLTKLHMDRSKFENDITYATEQLRQTNLAIAAMMAAKNVLEEKEPRS